MYIADYYNHRIRKVTISTGIITTVAGTGTQSYSGDNGQATSANLDSPAGVAFDSAGSLLCKSLHDFISSYFYLGNVYIADRFNQRIRKVTVSTGIITTVAGTGTQSYSGDGGAATSATLKNPIGIALDSSGTLLLKDCYNFYLLALPR